jgi:pimeloyl-ACP methyl ester carboxylesterase
MNAEYTTHDPRRVDRTFHGPNGDFHWIDWGGSGPLLHIGHATGFCAGIYSPLARRLRSRLHVVGMDDRGHGLTTAPADPKRLKDWGIFADDLERFLDHFGRPVIAAGHSRGGSAAVMAAERRPDLIQALILIDPTILPLSWIWWWAVKKAGLGRRIPIARTAANRRNNWPDRAAVYKSWVGRGPFAKWREGFLEHYAAEGVKDNPDGAVSLACDPVWESTCFAAANHYDWGRIARLKQPVLVLYGLESDTFLRPAVRRFAKTAPHAIMIGYEKTGHFVPMERPDRTASDILSFLTDRGLLPEPEAAP